MVLAVSAQVPVRNDVYLTPLSQLGNSYMVIRYNMITTEHAKYTISRSVSVQLEDKISTSNSIPIQKFTE